MSIDGGLPGFDGIIFLIVFIPLNQYCTIHSGVPQHYPTVKLSLFSQSSQTTVILERRKKTIWHRKIHCTDGLYQWTTQFRVFLTGHNFIKLCTGRRIAWRKHLYAAPKASLFPERMGKHTQLFFCHNELKKTYSLWCKRVKTHYFCPQIPLSWNGGQHFLRVKNGYFQLDLEWGLFRKSDAA